MLFVYISFLFFFLIYCYLVASWSRFHRMGYKGYTPRAFLKFPRRYYIIRWILLALFIGFAFLVEFPFWLVLILVLCSVWAGRQYTAFKLNLEFRDMQRHNELIDENGKPQTPKEVLESAYRAEKRWVEAYKNGQILW